MASAAGVGKREVVRATSDVSALALTALGWLAGTIATLLIIGTPYLVFGYYSVPLHLVLNTADAFIALLVAYLLLGRYLRGRRLQDSLLTAGLLLLGVAGLGGTIAVAHFESSLRGTLDVWLPLTLRVTAAILVLLAAVAGNRLVRPAGRRFLTAALCLVLAVVLLWWFRDRLPVALDQTPPTSTARPVITGHPLLITAQGVSAACFLLASLFFTRQAMRRHDDLLRWLGPACALAGFARVHYVLFPSLYTGWIYTGDVLRTAFYVLLLVGAAREIGQYWSAHARAAVLEDRSRLARELHDGVIQEIGYIRSQAHEIKDEGMREILAACDRALDEARAAVDALGRNQDEALGFALHRAANQVAERYGGRVDVQLDDSISVDQEQRHALVRITREAVSNALRHGEANCVRIRLTRDGAGCRLVVEDDGQGFDPPAVLASATGYGLLSMEARAQGLPGALRIDSEPGGGTNVEVTW